MKGQANGGRGWFLPGLHVLTSLLALFALLPLAGGLPGVGSQGQPLADGFWFTLILGGALALLAGGLKPLLRKVPMRLFALLYTASVGVLGTLRLLFAGFHFLVPGWLLMTLCIGGLLFSLRHPRLWVAVGAIWSALLLGACSAEGVIGFLTIDTRQLSSLLPLQIVAFVLVIVLLVAHLRRPDGVVDGV
ncbi:MAG: hypothetical protein ABSF64_04540 [Bryobacteraceae bacterium]|jgi:hypothetical protein